LIGRIRYTGGVVGGRAEVQMSHWWWRIVRGALLWLVLCSITLGDWSASRSRVASAAQDAGVVSIEGWSFAVLPRGAATVYVGESIPTALGERLAAAVGTASIQAPTLLGYPPIPLAVYLLPDTESLQQVLSQFGAGSVTEISDQAAVSRVGGVRPGLYADASVLRTEGEMSWVTAHEFTRRVLEAQRGEAPTLAYWFEKGVADAVASRVTYASEPALVTRRQLTADARIAAAGYADRLPTLSLLATRSAWTAAERTGMPVAESAWAEVETLLGERGLEAVRNLRDRLRPGVAFEEAFTQTFGQPVTQVDAHLRILARGPLAQAFPRGVSSRPWTGTTDPQRWLVFIGAQPGELVTWRFEGPDLCAGEGEPIEADPVGFSAYLFNDGLAARLDCAGFWQAEVRGDRGSTGDLTFFVLPNVQRAE
jgi:hypothetical protein